LLPTEVPRIFTPNGGELPEISNPKKPASFNLDAVMAKLSPTKD
jgi:hypothetical protein